MSAGAFTVSRYESDSGDIHPIRVQPETITAFNNEAPAGAVSSDISAVVSLTRRQRGLRPRYISVKFTADPPTNYAAGTVYRIPILKASVYDGLNIGGTGTYLATACVIVGKEGERAR